MVNTVVSKKNFSFVIRVTIQYQLHGTEVVASGNRFVPEKGKKSRMELNGGE